SSEIEQLFQLINGLKKEGVGIVYVSHRLEEIFKISDRITVLKDGQYVKTVNTKEIDEHTLVNTMIGRELTDYYPKRNAKIGDIVFEAKNISNGIAAKNVSFHVRAGEVLGLSGLVGSGRTETARAIFGADKKDSGEVYLYGKKIKTDSPWESVKQGIGFLVEDRKSQGVLLDLSCRINITMSSIRDYKKAFDVIDTHKEKKRVQELIDQLKIKTAGQEADVKSLSGGNQQKVAFAKWIASNSKVLILDEPTRGVDVGAKIEIYKIINQLAEEGMPIIMISSEMPEIIGMCDRVIVMHEGMVAGEIDRQEICEEKLIHFAMGVG
ncbi:MAG: sugar ABC transporter ATP-binding protein, partial [Christensenella sp.]|uniref:sugar ABC transporter ATP-binding protein n=1 Tax=Christensenella sp. TaxID=1935934 RepID=UPI002B21E9DC